MNDKQYSNLKFDEKLEFFSTSKVSAVPFYPEPFELRFMARVGGRNVTLGRDNKTKGEALQEARDYKNDCAGFSRCSVQAKLFDEKLEARQKGDV